MINDDIFYDCPKISPEQKQLIDKEESRRNNDGNCTKNVVQGIISDESSTSCTSTTSTEGMEVTVAIVDVTGTNNRTSTRTTTRRNQVDPLEITASSNKAAAGSTATSSSSTKSMTTGRLIESMSEIVKSPYEGIECAEVGEDCFDKLKNMLEPVVPSGGSDPSSSSSSDQIINPKMNSLFGDVLARTLYDAYSEIGHSGMLFSANWREGKIRNKNLGWIPKRQLLLCLREHRFAKANVSLLQAVIKNLDCVELVIETMKTWNLFYEYPNLASNTNTNDKAFIFNTQKARCLKCMIFVARGFACMQNLNIASDISSSLTKNIKACLSIMNRHVRPNQKGLTKIMLKINRKIASSSSSSKSKKKKTKAGPKTTGLPAEVVVEQCESASSSSDDDDDDHQLSAKRPSVNISSSRTCGVVHKEANNTSCRPRKKVRKDDETPESLLVSFNIMREQVQRLNQMMDFFQTLLYEHRNDLREEISDTIMSENRDGDESDIDNTRRHEKNRRRTY
ncbi:hypothetical protein FRACYDRAFT_233406 [Fragilariopsis cylindrus CCMP1102]|uniref:Uncharacterized protein n=1 Tax=Fragilariopsis cylindrus CCMP1102 TaxID=635003 RepID=A0A1E7FYM4_9STRA|nr:hypothetical protein FRACYDRAFT_233406 [Fragilariopsis cylindrus CCMP1102]|eukprot:OEU23236.1 hypothetical protein FRACYDRAFT_233406 [Fragilariopsis cylindrus CCMP1102]